MITISHVVVMLYFTFFKTRHMQGYQPSLSHCWPHCLQAGRSIAPSMAETYTSEMNPKLKRKVAPMLEDEEPEDEFCAAPFTYNAIEVPAPCPCMCMSSSAADQQ